MAKVQMTIIALSAFAMLLVILHSVNVLQARDARILMLEQKLTASEKQVKELQSFVQRCVHDAS
jgi:hypothetical protein